MTTNSRGSYRTTKQNMMRAFDKLPAEVREALANAPENWVAQPFLTALRRGQFDAPSLVRWIETLSRVELNRREDYRRRAVRAYRGNMPDAAAGIRRR